MNKFNGYLKLRFLLVIVTFIIIICAFLSAYLSYSQYKQKEQTISLLNSMQEIASINLTKFMELSSNLDKSSGLADRVGEKTSPLTPMSELVTSTSAYLNNNKNESNLVSQTLFIIMSSSVVILTLASVIQFYQSRKEKSEIEFDNFLKSYVSEEEKPIEGGVEGKKEDELSVDDRISITKQIMEDKKFNKLSILISNLTELTINKLNNEIRQKYTFLCVNLITGICLVCTSVFIALYATPYISLTSTMKSDDNFINLASKIVLVITINLIAFFFIRAYKQGVDSIRNINNEIVNIESKRVGIIMAISYNNKIMVESAINSMLSVERNFILNKGQTTIELEKIKTDEYELNKLHDFIKCFMESMKNKV